MSVDQISLQNQSTVSSSPDESTPLVKPRASTRNWSILFLVLAIVFGLAGWNAAYKDAQVVGGDAYNYIIGAGRGTAIVGIGIICALISVVFAVFDLTNRLVYYTRIKR